MHRQLVWVTQQTYHQQVTIGMIINGWQEAPSIMVRENKIASRPGSVRCMGEHQVLLN